MNKFLFEAMRQSARDVGCEPSDFMSDKNMVLRSRPAKNAKAIYPPEPDFLLVRYGCCSVVSVKDIKYPEVSAYFSEHEYLCPCDLPTLGFIPMFETVWFLPADDDIAPLSCPYEIRFLKPEDFSELYLPEWSNALSKKRPHLDKMAVGAYDGEKLIGLAGASQDAENMLQIGIDVLSEYRRRGVASALTSTLAHEIIIRGQTPFYSCWWSNVPSLKNTVRSGFVPAWTEIEAKLI